MVIVSPSSVTSANVKTRSFWLRLWSIGKIAGPAVIAVAAILISLLTYEDQHSASQLTAANSQRQQAERVSFWVNYGSNEDLIVENRSRSALDYAIFNVKINVDNRFRWISLWLADAIPPCSTATANVKTTLEKIRFKTTGDITHVYADKPIPLQGIIWDAYMEFEDQNGLGWTIWSSGLLQRTKPVSLHDSMPFGDVSAKLMPSGSCSS